MNIIALMVVVTGAGLFSIAFVCLVSNRILSRLGALLTLAAGMVIGAAILSMLGSCAGYIPAVDKAVIESWRSNNLTDTTAE